jgi:tRNA(Ile)-lysidine synthase
MLAPGDSVGVAVSGGADSVTLLQILHRLAAYEITVLHVNHQLRGAESEADEEFVRELAAKLGFPIEVKQAPVGAGNMEQLARDARRAFFAEVRVRLGLRRIALGHNQSDQAETVLYRFLRGSGLAGLAGMRPVTQDGLIRPLIHLTREEIRSWAAAENIAWREDSSNDNIDLVRNRMRLKVFNPQLVQVLSANAVVAQDEEDWWSERIAGLYRSVAQETTLGLQFSVAALMSLHAAEQRRVIRHAISQVKGDLRSIDLSHVEAVRKVLQSEAGHDRILLPGIDVLRSFGTVVMAQPGKLGSEPRHYEIFAEIGKEVALPYDNGRLYVNWVKPDDRFCGNFGVEPDVVREVVDFDGDVLDGAGRLKGLLVRNWEPGDAYVRAGHEKPEKIKSLFQEHRVVLWDRRRWPVMILDDEIVWSRHFGVAEKFQARDQSRSILRLVYSQANQNAGNYVT